MTLILTTAPVFADTRGGGSVAPVLSSNGAFFFTVDASSEQRRYGAVDPTAGLVAAGLWGGRYKETVTSTEADSLFYGLCHYHFGNGPVSVGVLLATFDVDGATGQTFVTLKIYDLSGAVIYSNSGWHQSGTVQVG